MAVAPKRTWPTATAMLPGVHDPLDPAAVIADVERLLDYVRFTPPTVRDHPDAAHAERLTFTGFPEDIWVQSWSTTSPIG